MMCVFVCVGGGGGAVCRGIRPIHNFFVSLGHYVHQKYEQKVVYIMIRIT